MVIYKADGTVRHDFGLYNVGSKLRRTLMGDDYIVLPFTLSEPVEFLLGDYHDVYIGEYFYGRYELVDRYKPTYDTATGTYRYELRLDASYMKWKNKILKYLPQTGGGELSFSLTSTLSVHLEIVLRNIRHWGYQYNGTDYSVAIDDTVDAQSGKLVTYDSVGIIDALTLIAKTYECEWWVTDSIIHFGTCQAPDATEEIPFILGDNISNMSSSNNGQEYITKLYVFGSERNLPSSYKKDVSPDLTKAAVVQRRLMLPLVSEMTAENALLLEQHGYTLNDDGSITVNGQDTEEMVEGIIVIDDIYPKTDLTVTSYRVIGDYVEEEDNEGHTTTTYYTYYRLYTNVHPVTEAMILDGATLHIIFRSGSMNGMDFECQAYDGGIPSDPTPYYEVVLNENYGRPLPDQDLHPNAGDTFALYNWDATKLSESTLIQDASNELLVKAVEYLDKSKIDPNTYTCTEDCFEDDYTLRDLGDRISLVNTAYFPQGRSSRVIGYEFNLDIPYDHPQYQCAEKVGYMFQSRVNSTDTLTFNGKTYENYSYGGSSVYLIRSDDRTRPTDSNTFSAKRILKDFLRRNIDDTAAGRITFTSGFDSQSSSTTTGLTNNGKLTNNGELTQNGDVVVVGTSNGSTSPVVKSNQFVEGSLGWQIDHVGNMEVESLTVRSLLKVTELLINRLQAQEGDTIFSDNDQIESLTDGGNGTYILTLKEKWDGYFTAMQYGAIVKGIINTLAAKQAGASDYSDTYTDKQDKDEGGNLYYTSWMMVTGVYNADPTTPGYDSSLHKNQIRVALWPDSHVDGGETILDVPSGKNFPPCAKMTIARWGCYLAPDAPGITIAEKQRRTRLQTLFMVSVSDGRIIKMTGVNKPILEQWNYGTTLGLLPDFVKEWAIADKLVDGRDYLYAQGIVVGDFIQVNINGEPNVKYVDCGVWQDGSQMADPQPGSGIYLVREHNDFSQQWETHDVWWKGCKWRALVHHPFTSGGVLTYEAPKWNSTVWQLLEGDGTPYMTLNSTNGNAFRRGSVNTQVIPTLFYGNMDITADVDDTYWSWTRKTENAAGYTPADESWNSNHEHVRVLTLTDSDMPQAWSRTNRAVFTCTVTVNDGKTTVIVENQVIA